MIHESEMTQTRMTPERLAEIERDARPGGMTYAGPKWKEDIRELLAELDAVTRERDEARSERNDWHQHATALERQRDEARKDSTRLDWLCEGGLGHNYLRLRTGRNMIGVSTGGWLLTHGRIGDGPESKHFDLREAIDAGMKEL